MVGRVLVDVHHPTTTTCVTRVSGACCVAVGGRGLGRWLFVGADASFSVLHGGIFVSSGIARCYAPESMEPLSLMLYVLMYHIQIAKYIG